MQDPITKLIRIVAEESDQEKVYSCAEDVLQSQIGHRLFTVLLYEPSYKLVSRCYSSDPEHFPVGGNKILGETLWGREVLKGGKTLMSRNREELKMVYPDYSLLFSLGLGSAVNIPVKSGGRTLGMLNLLHDEYFYTREKLKDADLIAGLLAGTFSQVSEAMYA
ncbi:GAF domain-containing protein [Sneathiella limimaris]|uniref:GAF domain-containing protein n=1 Tax=Sneathiella limimaris TaxID=1964213 RepID=UPI00146D6E39|nr:GAF domain-containing protein [Sneathiella limimaris]